MSASVWQPGSTVSVNSANDVASQSFQATLNQTLFTLTNFNYVPGTGSLLIFVNGAVQRPGIDFFETSSSSFTLADASYANDVVLAIGFNYTEAVASSSDAANINYTPPFSGAVSTTVKLKEAQLVSVKDFGAVGNGVADDTGNIQAAIAYCYANNSILYWPAGTYLTTSSLTNLHAVRHIGSGIIKRGSDLFYVAPVLSQANTLYVSPAGSATNDGLTSSQPIGTVQIAFDSLKNYGPVLDGSWTLRLAAGTYNAASQLIGLRSRNSIVIRGPSVGGSPNVPTAIVDGTGVVSNVVGWYFQYYIKVDVYDIKFQNWTSVAGDSYGLCADGHCEIYTNNLHAYNCRYAGVSFDNITQATMQGGIIDSCTFSGVRTYSQVSLSIGYSGISAGDSTEIKNCSVGISGRVSSRIHVDYCNIHNNDTGIAIEYNSRCVVNYSKVQNNNIGWYATLTADIQTSYDGSNVMSGNAKDFICYSSNLSSSTAKECNYSIYWDETTKRWLYGASSYRTPNAKYEWQLDSAASNSYYNGNVKAIFDFNGATNYLGLSGPATAFTGILWSAPAKSAQALIGYNFTSDVMDFSQGAAQQYRMQSTQFVPLSDNNKTLGNGSFRWSVVYAGSGVINTSDGRDKQQLRSLSIAEGKVAKRIKNLVKAFKFNDAVAAKGDNARTHFGVVAQDIKDAFTAEGLDVSQYGLFCYDEWPEQQEVKDSDGNILNPHVAAGNRYGIRYEELLAFIISTL